MSVSVSRATVHCVDCPALVCSARRCDTFSGTLLGGRQPVDAGRETAPQSAQMLTPPPFRYHRLPPPGLGPDSFERESLPARLSASALHGRVKELLEQIADVDRCVCVFVRLCLRFQSDASPGRTKKPEK